MQIDQLLTKWNWLSTASAKIPPSMFSGAAVVVRYTRARMRLRIPLIRYEVSLGEHGKHGSIITADYGIRTSEIVHAAFGKPLSQKTIGHASWWKLPAMLDRWADDVDLVVTRFHAQLAKKRFDRRYLRVPEAVECFAEVSADGSLPPRAKRGQDGNLRLLRKSKLRWELSHDPADFEQFYYEMYVPYVRRRFGEYADERSKQYWRDLFLRGGLMWILDGDQRVAGSIYTTENGEFVSCIGGIADGDAAMLKRGVTPAMDVFSFELAAQLGVRRYNMGLSRPWLNDGVLAYKRRWGAELRTGQLTYNNFYVRWDRFNPLVARLLGELPLLVHDDPGISGIIAIEDSDVKATEDQVVERLAAGLAMSPMRHMCVLTSGSDQPRQIVTRDERLQGTALCVMPSVSSAKVNKWMSEHPPHETHETHSTSPADKVELTAGV